jgi:pilus assembly protein CpaB
MKRKLAAVVVLALLAGVSHFGYLRAVAAEARGGEPMQVLVAAESLAVGQVLEAAHAARRAVPAAYVDERAIPAARVSEAVGLELAVEVAAGDVLAWTDFTERAEPTARDLARLIGSGQRAMTIPVDQSLSLGGMLRPGHRVDILGTFARGSRAKTDRVTVTLLQNVTVLATGRDLTGEQEEGRSRQRYSTATLSVGLEEAELLAFATTLGSLSLVLRGEQDLTRVRDVPEKGIADVWEAERRNALQSRSRGGSEPGIERLDVR